MRIRAQDLYLLINDGDEIEKCRIGVGEIKEDKKVKRAKRSIDH